MLCMRLSLKNKDSIFTYQITNNSNKIIMPIPVIVYVAGGALLEAQTGLVKKLSARSSGSLSGTKSKKRKTKKATTKKRKKSAPVKRKKTAARPRRRTTARKPRRKTTPSKRRVTRRRK